MGCRTRRILSSLFFLAVGAFAQTPDQVKWSLNLEPSTVAPGAKVLARLAGSIDPGWHVYSMTTAAAIPTTVKVAANAAVEKFRVFQASPKKAFDQNFNLETETYENVAAFLIELQLKPDAAAGSSEISAEVRYQT